MLSRLHSRQPAKTSGNQSAVKSKAAVNPWSVLHSATQDVVSDDEDNTERQTFQFQGTFESESDDEDSHAMDEDEQQDESDEIIEKIEPKSAEPRHEFSDDAPAPVTDLKRSSKPKFAVALKRFKDSATVDPEKEHPTTREKHSKLTVFSKCTIVAETSLQWLADRITSASPTSDPEWFYYYFACSNLQSLKFNPFNFNAGPSEWQHAFQSLHSQWTGKCIDYFYWISSDVKCVMSSDIITGQLLIQVLESPPGMSRFLSSLVFVESFVVSKKKQFKLVNSSDIHKFVNYVMNNAHQLTLTNSDPGHLISSSPFTHGSLRKVCITKNTLVSNMKDASMSKSYLLELQGPLLPKTMSVLQEYSGSFTSIRKECSEIKVLASEI